MGIGNAVSLYNSIYLDLYVNGGRGRESCGREIQGQTKVLVGSIPICLLELYQRSENARIVMIMEYF